jgi:hypothetical protein
MCSSMSATRSRRFDMAAIWKAVLPLNSGTEKRLTMAWLRGTMSFRLTSAPNRTSCIAHSAMRSWPSGSGGMALLARSQIAWLMMLLTVLISLLGGEEAAIARTAQVTTRAVDPAGRTVLAGIISRADLSTEAPGATTASMSRTSPRRAASWHMLAFPKWDDSSTNMSGETPSTMAPSRSFAEKSDPGSFMSRWNPAARRASTSSKFFDRTVIAFFAPTVSSVDFTDSSVRA